MKRLIGGGLSLEIGGRAATIALLLGLVCCSRNPRPEPLLVFAAASATDAVSEITVAFERETGLPVRCNFAASSALARQIETGADADLFLSANERWADVLVRDGLVEARLDLLGNTLVIVVPENSPLPIASPEDLLDARVERISLADPDSVPAGIYAKQALLGLGLWGRLKGKVVRGFDVRQALLFVERGEAEAGLVYATDAAISSSVRVAVEVDASLTEPIRYPLALLKSARDKPGARQLFDYLQAKPAGEVFRKLGFKRVED